MGDAARNFLSARQIADELKKFIGYAENAQNSTNLQVRYHGVAISDIAALLLRLRNQLTTSNDHRHTTDFANDFVSQPNNGIDLLLRTLALVQQQLFEANQQNRLASILQRNQSNKRRKSGHAEATCLQNLQILLAKTNAWRLFMEHVSNLETVLISLNSPQLDSKCYSLEISTSILEHADGFVLLFKALTSLSGKKRDECRLSEVINQLRFGLQQQKLTIQLLVVRFLNRFITSAPTMNHRILLQCEAEIAGFYADRLEKILRDYKQAEEVDLIRKEIRIWNQNYLQLTEDIIGGHRAVDRTRSKDQFYRNQLNQSTDTLQVKAPVQKARRRRGSPPTPETEVPRRGSILRQNEDANRISDIPISRTQRDDSRTQSGPSVFFNDDYASVPDPVSDRLPPVTPNAIRQGKPVQELRSRTPEPRNIDYEREKDKKREKEYRYRRPDEDWQPARRYRQQQGGGDRSLSAEQRSRSLHGLNEIENEKSNSEHIIPVRFETAANRFTGERDARFKEGESNLRKAGRQYQSHEQLGSAPRSFDRSGPDLRVSGDRTKPRDNGGDKTRNETPDDHNLVHETEEQAHLRRSRSDVTDVIRMQGFSYLFPGQNVVETVPVRSPSPEVKHRLRRQQADRPDSRQFDSSDNRALLRPGSVTEYIQDSRPESREQSRIGHNYVDQLRSSRPQQYERESTPRYRLQDSRLNIHEGVGDPLPPPLAPREAHRNQLPPPRPPPHSKIHDGPLEADKSDDHVIYIPIRMEPGKNDESRDAQFTRQRRSALKPAPKGPYDAGPEGFREEHSFYTTAPQLSNRRGGPASVPIGTDSDVPSTPREGMLRHRYVPSRSGERVTAFRRGGGRISGAGTDSDFDRSSGSKRSMPSSASAGSKGRLRQQPSSISQDEVDDALRNFDYLNDYSVDESSYLSNRYAIDR